MTLPSAILEQAVDQLSSLHGVGKRSALRYALPLMGCKESEVADFCSALMRLKTDLHHCKICNCVSDTELCPVCSSPKRQQNIICVVENVESMMAIENTNEFKGTYHVLHGVISPLEEVRPEDITVKELLARINADEVTEVIMATGSSVEGELTAMYISKLLKPLGVKVTRLAYGLPVGATLEYADSVTLSKAFEGRREV